jgi:penicillin-binding protein 1A
MGKTGTTNSVKDAWFAGSTKDFTSVVWVGFDKPCRILNSYASVIALPLWVKVVNLAPRKAQTHAVKIQW